MRYSITILPDETGTRVLGPEIVELDVNGPVPILTTRPLAEKALLMLGVLPHNFDHFITGDPDAIEEESLPC